MSLTAEKQQQLPLWCLRMCIPLIRGFRKNKTSIQKAERNEEGGDGEAVRSKCGNYFSAVFHDILFSCFPVFAFYPAGLSHRATEPSAAPERVPLSA